MIVAAAADDYSNYTTAALEDKFLEVLHSNEKYIEKAKRLIYRINIYEHPPGFVISERDTPKGLVKALEGLGTITMNKVITNVVRRLYASVDFHYYHTSGIYSKVKWGFED